MTYFNGHIHTDMSNIRMLDSTNKVEPVIDYAIELGLAGIAITDHESIGNHIKAMLYLEGKKKKAKEVLDSNPEDMEAKRILNFKLGLGNEIYLCRDGLSQKNYIKGEDGFFHFILIAKDKIGHHQIRLLTSRAWDRSFYQFIERVPTYYSDIEKIVGQNPGHLIATTACLGGYFPKLLLAGKDQIALNFLNWCKDIFREENFFIEIQPGISQEQKLFNILALDFAKKNNFKITVATDAHYLKEEDRKVHKSFLNSGEGDREVDAFYATTYLMSPEETLEKLNYLPKKDLEEIFKTSLSISDKIEEYSLANKQIIPRIPLDFSSFKDRVFSYNNYPYITKFFESEYEEDVYFISSIFKKAQDLNILDKPHLDRLEKECEEIWIVSDKIEERLSAYFITVKKVIQLAWEEGDTLVGPWRGSVGSMLCAYLMDVVQRDPLKSPIELPYWRFCSRGRAELADVDIDSQASKREKFIAAVRKYFESIGGELTPVATFGTETSKAALQTAVRGLGYEPELGTYLSSLVLVDRGFVRSLKQCYYGDEEKGFSPISQFVIEMDNYPDVWEVAKGIEGLISRRGIHASGVILTNTPFTDLGATMKSPKGVKCSQWELHTEEYAGHIKYDFLTTDALDRIRTCLDLLLEYKYIEWQGSLKETYWKYLNPDVLDYQDHDMWKLVGENKIISLFQFDTPQGLSTAKQIKPNSLLELAQANSLMRLMPEAGKMSPVEEFVKYKENPSLLKQDIYSLKATEKEKEILYNFMKTYGGVLDSQESLMLAVMIPEFTNYSVDEANKVRKVVAKKKMKEISKTREDFYQRGRANGVSEDILYYIWDVQAAKQMGYS